MKTLLLFMALAACSTQVQAQKFSTAIEYNDYIVEQQNSIASAMFIFNEGLNDINSTKENATENLNGLKAATKTSLEKVRKMSGFEGNIELRDAIIDLFSFYQKSFSNEYGELINLLYKEDFDENTMSEMERILNGITQGEQLLDANFAAAQEAFAKEHGFVLSTNEWQEKLNEE